MSAPSAGQNFTSGNRCDLFGSSRNSRATEVVCKSYFKFLKTTSHHPKNFHLSNFPLKVPALKCSEHVGQRVLALEFSRQTCFFFLTTGNPIRSSTREITPPDAPDSREQLHQWARSKGRPTFPPVSSARVLLTIFPAANFSECWRTSLLTFLTFVDVHFIN